MSVEVGGQSLISTVVHRKSKKPQHAHTVNTPQLFTGIMTERSTMRTLTDATFQAATMNNKAIVMFTSPSCSACNALKPVLETYQEETNTPVYELNVEESTYAHKLGIRALPTTILFRRGEEVDRIIGTFKRSELSSWSRPETPAYYHIKRR